MSRVALIETKVSRNNYTNLFDNKIDIDIYQLCSDPSIKKVLVKDVDIDIDLDEYDKVILVGADAFKYYTKKTSIMEYSGKLVNDKFLPVINPAMLHFKPEMRRIWDKSKESVLGYIDGSKKQVKISGIGITDSVEAGKFITKALSYNSPYFAIDSETTGLYPRDGYILGISLSYDGKKGAYISSDAMDEVNCDLVQKLFKKKTAIFHNAKFDKSFFQYHFNWKIYNYEDTMLLHYLIHEVPGTHGLKQQAMDFTDYGDYEQELYVFIDTYCKQHGLKKSEFTWDLIPFEIMKDYAAVDAIVTYQIFEKFVNIKKNAKLKSVYDNILIPGTDFLIDMENNGVPFSKERLVNAQHLMEEEITKSIEELYSFPEIKKFEEVQGKSFNPNSVLQLRKLLFDYLGLRPLKRTEKGAPSTDAEVLEKLASESRVPALILDIRKKSKIKNTYLDKIIPQLNRDSRLRTGFNLHTTTSGRLSSSGKLNMQQLPRDNPIVKGCIKARPGYKIVAMDLGTAEMYIAAAISGDKALQEVFRAGTDFHSTIAKKVFNLPCTIDEVKDLYPLARQSAKAISFGILYGATAYRVSAEVTKAAGTLFSVEEAQEAIDDYFRQFKTLKKWIDKNKEDIANNGFIYSIFGRKRRLPNVMSDDSGIRSHEIRSGLNFLVQSVASDINLMAAIDTNEWIKRNQPDTKIFGLVHDSILAEVKDEDVSNYIEMLQKFVQIDRGVSIKGTPISTDFDIGDDYSMGKFEKEYPDFAMAA